MGSPIKPNPRFFTRKLEIAAAVPQFRPGIVFLSQKKARGPVPSGL
jgi:hypothetical protein